MAGFAMLFRRRLASKNAWMRVAAVAIVAAAVCAGVGPMRAFATYADFDEGHAAAQDLGAYGSEMSAADIPDGTYEVAARTDSYMCIFYRNAADAANRTSKEKCYVQVSGGRMTAVFYISSMYNRLYLGGDAEDAASLTNEDGTDDSRYLVGDPADGYVPHLFTMDIPALNYPMQFAAFAGAQYPISDDPGSTWHTRAKWYSHVVVFKPTQDTLRAIEDAARAIKSADDIDAGPGANDDVTADASPDGSEAAHASGGRAAASSNVSVPVPIAASGDDLAAIAASAGPDAGAGDAAQPQDDAASRDETARGAAATGGRRGLVLSPASFDLPESSGGGSADDIARADEGAEGGRDPVAALAFGGVALVAAGAGCRFALFSLSKRTGGPHGHALL